MKKMKKFILTNLIVLFISITAFAQEIAPYIKVTESSESINQISEKVIDVLKNDNFTILGTYNPSNKKR